MYNIKQIIEELDDKHSNAIPIFCGAISAYECAERGDIDGFVKHLPHVVCEAKFRNWHEGIVGALNRFCRMCFIDPMLIEAYLGMRFEELIKQ